MGQPQARRVQAAIGPAASAAAVDNSSPAGPNTCGGGARGRPTGAARSSTGVTFAQTGRGPGARVPRAPLLFQQGISLFAPVRPSPSAAPYRGLVASLLSLQASWVFAIRTSPIGAVEHAQASARNAPIPPQVAQRAALP